MENVTPIPRVSVIMPAHDRVAVGLFDKATQSILTQTFADFEFLILLDGVRSPGPGIEASANSWAGKGCTRVSANRFAYLRKAALVVALKTRTDRS